MARRAHARPFAALAVEGLAIALLAISGFSAAPAHAQWRLPPGTDGWREAGLEGIRGVTIGPIESSLHPGRGYGTEHTAALLDFLARRGVNWVSVTPFGRLWSLSSRDIDLEFEAPYEDNRRGIRALVEQAHARGIRVLLIPHLWVDTGGWRGEVDPGDPEGWAEYQASYAAFVMAWAADAEAAGVDAFSIGVECKSWSGRFGAYWTELIRGVRETFAGFLTYSANWDEAEDVLFWDQLDLIGINAFYPLADHDDASFAEYLEGALRARDAVAQLAGVLDMPVLFVEVGYTTRRNAAVEPWLWPDDMTQVVVDEQEQARALLASLRAFLPEEWLAGFFVWRYYADLDDVSQEAIWGFSPHAKLAERVLFRILRQPFGVDPGPYAFLERPVRTPTFAEILRETDSLVASTVIPR